MHRETLSYRQQSIVGGHDGIGEVARLIDDRRAAGFQQRVRHFPHDAVEPVRHHREGHRIKSRADNGGRLSGRGVTCRLALPGNVNDVAA